MTGHTDDRLEDVRRELLEPLGQRAEQAPPGAAVRAETGRGRVDRPPQGCSASAVQRMTELHLGPAPDEPHAAEVEPLRERRSGGQGMDRRAVVVHEAGHRELAGPGATTEPVGRLEHRDVHTGRGEGEGGGKAVGTAADNDGGRHAVSMPRGAVRRD